MQRPPDHLRGAIRHRLRRRPSARTGLLTGGLVASVLLGAGPGTAGGLHRTLQVIGGTSAAQGELPFLAFIQSHDSTYVYSCSGTLITPNAVLTAGHCAYGEDGRPLAASSFSVTLGAVTPDPGGPSPQPGEHYGVRSITAHSGTSDTLGGDVAVIVLSGSSSIAPVALAGRDDATLEVAGTPAIVAGWGLTSVGGPPASTLQKGAETIQGNDACLAAHRSFDAVHQLCAASPGYRPAVCNGDSGGPLLVGSPRGPVEIGVVSYSLGTCGSSADYHARVSAFVDWIRSAAGAGSPAAAPTPAPSAASVYAAPGIPQARYDGATLAVAFQPAAPVGSTILTGYGVTLRAATGDASAYRVLAPDVTAATFASPGRGTYRVEVQALYSTGSSAIVASDTVSVAQPSPEAPATSMPALAAVAGVAAPVISGVRRYGSRLSCSRGAWSWGGTAPVSRVWLRNGRPTGATGPTYLVGRADEGRSISCRATLRTSVGDVGPQTSATVRIADPLRVLSPPRIVGRPVVGGTLTCTRGRWAHTGPVRYRTSWQRDGRSTGSGRSYLLGPADAGRVVRCVVRARDAVETEEAGTASVRALGGGA